MKRILLFLSAFLFFAQGAYAINDAPMKDFGIAKYAVMEINRDYSPIRLEPDVNAPRYTHLRRGVVLYADKEMGEFYRVDLGLNKFYWIEKKYADIAGVIPKKHIQNVNKLVFDEDKDKYKILIPTDIKNSYSFEQTQQGLKFHLYDVNFFDAGKKIKKEPNFDVYLSADTVMTLEYITPAVFGYDVKTDKKGLVVEIKKIPKRNPKKPLNNIKIMIDPGHGGEETGVCAFNHQEKDVNLEISKKLKRELSKKGAKVYMTRTRDKFSGLYERIDLAQKKDAQILISVHQNSLANPQDVVKKHGVGVYYYNKQAKPLAQSIQKELVAQSGFRDDGVNFASFALTRPTLPVSVLVECGYLIDENEMKKLTDKKFQKEFSRALAKGVEEYMRYLVVY